MAWMVSGLNPGRGNIFHTHPDWPWGPLNCQHNEYQISPPTVQQPGCGVDHSAPTHCQGQRKCRAIPLLPPLGLHSLLLGEFFTFSMLKSIKFYSSDCTVIT